jgi:leader peptidase (prepilin peptidase)/N-methyltransferase
METSTIVIAAAAAGLLAGWAATVVAWRLPRGQALSPPLARCTTCSATVTWRDAVPIAGWLALRRRCRACGSAISARYPLVEVGVAATFALVAAVVGDHPAELVRDLVLVAFIVPAALIDAEHRIIPNKITLAAALTGVALFPLEPSFIPEQLASAAGAFGFYLLFALIRPGALGMGDVKLAGVMGLYLGVAVAAALVIASLVSVAVAIVVALRHGRKAAKEPRPFGPALAVGAVVAMLVGADLVDLWVNGS